MPIPDHRIAICKRCRWPERIARGADDDQVLKAFGKAWSERTGFPVHVRASQCLNCCDGGHTVRVEYQGNEVALVGIRTEAELERVLENIEAIAEREVPAGLAKRVYQVWVDGEMVFHKNLDGDE